MAEILDGKLISSAVKHRIKSATDQMKIKPVLAVIIVGEDPASMTYVKGKKKDAEECGIVSLTYDLKEETSQEELLSLINRLNCDPNIDAILCQLPLPKHIDEQAVINAIVPHKDVDCFNPANVGKLSIGKPEFLPCTPAGVMELLDAYGIDVAGKECVVLGRSNIVGKPMAMLLTANNATVTVCHSKTWDIKEHLQSADIIISAMGRPGTIHADMIREGSVVVDVSINRDENGKMCGDVVFDEVAEKASYITPVPGGVGPMTRAMLMKNVLLAAQRRKHV